MLDLDRSNEEITLISWLLNGTNYLYSSDQHTLDFVEYSNDIRIEVDGDTRLTGAKDFFDAPGIGDWDIDKLIDNDKIDESFYADTGIFTVLEVSGEDSIRFSFIMTDGSDNLSGSGCIGYSNCGLAPSAVPVPAAAWLFGSSLLGLVGIGRRK